MKSARKHELELVKTFAKESSFIFAPWIWNHFKAAKYERDKRYEQFPDMVKSKMLSDKWISRVVGFGIVMVFGLLAFIWLALGLYEKLDIG